MKYTVPLAILALLGLSMHGSTVAAFEDDLDSLDNYDDSDFGGGDDNFNDEDE